MVLPRVTGNSFVFCGQMKGRDAPIKKKGKKRGGDGAFWRRRGRLIIPSEKVKRETPGEPGTVSRKGFQKVAAGVRNIEDFFKLHGRRRGERLRFGAGLGGLQKKGKGLLSR